MNSFLALIWKPQSQVRLLDLPMRSVAVPPSERAQNLLLKSLPPKKNL